MPMLMMLRMGLPVWPFHAPLRTLVGEGGHLVQHLMHGGDDVFAVDPGLTRPWARGERRGARRGLP